MTKVLRYSIASEQPWRNGRGVTRELHAGDGWRLSVATISSAGEFSFFPGLERTFVPARGRLEVTVDGSRHLVSPGTVLRFSGEAAVSAVPLDGEAIAVNVMTERERCTATVRLEQIDGPSPAATALVLLSGQARLSGQALVDDRIQRPGQNLLSGQNLVDDRPLGPLDALHLPAAEVATCSAALMVVIDIELSDPSVIPPP